MNVKNATEREDDEQERALNSHNITHTHTHISTNTHTEYTQIKNELIVFFFVDRFFNKSSFDDKNRIIIYFLNKSIFIIHSKAIDCENTMMNQSRKQC